MSVFYHIAPWGAIANRNRRLKAAHWDNGSLARCGLGQSYFSSSSVPMTGPKLYEPAPLLKSAHFVEPV